MSVNASLLVSRRAALLGLGAAISRGRVSVAVATALSEQRHLVVEAGTGVGKSLAYLVPSVMWAVEQKKKAAGLLPATDFASATPANR